MKDPTIQAKNEVSDSGILTLVLYQTSSGGGWKEITAWHSMPLGQGSRAEVSLPEDYSIALRYVVDEATIETERTPVSDGIGNFQIRGNDGAISLHRMPDGLGEYGEGRLNVDATASFRQVVDLLIFRGKERVFPAIQMPPGFSTSQPLSGPLYLAQWNAGIGTDFTPELLDAVEVQPGQRVTITGSKHEGYILRAGPESP